MVTENTLPLQLVFILTVATVNVLSFPTGAPTDVCVTMQPATNPHGAPQPGPAPYKISVYPSTYMPGADIMVNISGNSSGDTLQGLLLQARRDPCTTDCNDAVGMFVVPTKLKTVDCGTGKMNAVTHSDRLGNIPSITATWKAPEGYMYPVRFRVTVVKQVTTYWMGIQSEPLMLNPNVTMAMTSEMYTSPMPSDLPVSTVPPPMPTVPPMEPTTEKDDSASSITRSSIVLTTGALILWKLNVL